jgi:hypothetical protein
MYLAYAHLAMARKHKYLWTTHSATISFLTTSGEIKDIRHNTIPLFASGNDLGTNIRRIVL